MDRKKKYMSFHTDLSQTAWKDWAERMPVESER